MMTSLYYIPSQEPEAEMTSGIQSDAFLYFIQSLILDCGVVLTIFPHRHAQRFISMVTPNPVRLTIMTEYYTWHVNKMYI